MNNTMYKKSFHKLFISALISVFACFFFLSEVSFAQTTNVSAPTNESAQEIHERTSLLFLGNKNLTHIISHDGMTPNGIAIDIVKAISKYLSKPVEIQATDWTDAQRLVAEGEADALIQINPTDERKKIYDFSGPLLETQISIFTRSTQGILDFENLHELRVGVEANSIPEHLLREHPGVFSHPEMNIVTINNFLDGFNLLKSNLLDAVVVDRRVGEYILANNNISGIKVSGDPIYSSYSAFAVKKGNKKLLDEINAGLSAIKTDGTYQKILSAWTPHDVIYQTREEATKTTYAILLTTLGILLFISLAWVFVIKGELKKRRSAEAALNDAQRLAKVGSWELDIAANKLSWSDEIYSIFEVEQGKFGASYEAFLERVHPDDREMVNLVYTNSVKNHEHYTAEHRLLMQDGRIKYVREQGETVYDDNGDATHSVGTVQDITREKSAEIAVRTSEVTLRQSIDTARDAIVVMGPDKRIIFWNKAAEEIFGYTREETVGKDLHALLASPEDQEAFAKKFPSFLETGVGPIVGRVRELVATHKDGSHFPIELSVSSTKVEGNWLATGIVRDISARKKAEDDIQKKNRSLRILSSTNQALIHATNEADFLSKICSVIMEDGKYRFVWIGYVDGKNLKDVAQAGLNEGYLQTINKEGGDGTQNTPEKEAVQSKKSVIIHEIKTETPDGQTWEAEALKRGYQSALAIPLFYGDDTFAVLTIYSPIANSFNQEEVSILQEMADDLSFGIRSLRLRAEREVSEEKFSATFHASPDIIVITRISDNVILDVNESFSEILGYSQEEVIGESANNTPVWGDRIDREVIIKSIRETGGVTGFETTLRRKDGSTIIGLGSARTIEIIGEPCILSIIHDITDRKKSEDARLTSLKFMESIDRVNKTILQTDDLDEMMKNVLDVVLSVFDCDRAWLITPCDPWSLSYRVPMERTKPEYPGASNSGMNIPVDPDTTLLFQKTRAVDGPVEFNSESDPPLPSEITKHFQVQSQLVMDIYPKVKDSWMFGMHQCSYERTWTDEEKRLFQEIGHRLADALTSLLISQDLKKSEEKYRRIIETTNEGVAMLDENRILTFVNARFSHLLGYGEAEMLGKKFDDFLVQEELQDHEQQMSDRHAGKSSVYDRRFVHKNGEIVWCTVSATPLFNEKGEFNGSFGMFTDITNTKKAEMELREQEQYSQSLLRLSRKVEQSHLYGEILTAAQEEIKEILGYTNVWAYLVDADKKYARSIAAIGSTSEMVMSEEFSATLKIEGDPMLEAIASAKEIVIVEDCQTDPNVNREIVEKMGNRTLVNVPITLFDRNLGSIGMGTFGNEGVRVPTKEEQEFLIAMASHMAVGFDRIRLLGERIKSENELARANSELFEEKTKGEALLESLGEGIIAVDRQGVIVAINHAAERITGWKEQELIGKNFAETIPALDETGAAIPKAERFVSKVLSSQSRATSGNIQYVRKDKILIPIAANVTPFVLNTEVIGAVSVFRDITNEKELEETRKDLLSLASHQLRTPLSGTKWLIETLKNGLKGPLNKDQQEYLDEIYKINERMTTLVHDMLGVLRMESGTIPSTVTEVAASKIIATEIDNLSPAAKGRGLTLRAEIETDTILSTDPVLLQQLLEVFIANGITYSDSGHEVTVNFHKADNEAIFEIRDQGIGIPKDEQTQIFQRFFRATNAKTFDTRGTGLGLYIATILAKKLGARLSFESEEGVGSKFRIHLPLDKNE